MMTAVKATRKARVPRRARFTSRSFPRHARGLRPTAYPDRAAGLDSRSKLATSGNAAYDTPVQAWKRCLDIFCILLSLPVTLPLLAAVTLWIKLASRGPALFRQERIGRNGKRFVLYKFRSMHLNADTRRHAHHFRQLVRSGRPMIKLDLLCDSRLIPGGCLLRAAGLDELPQLLNVLRGEMSLVGPRPCLAEEYRYFNETQRERFNVLPGLTGLWQVEGKGRTTFRGMNEMDARYVRESSPLMDLGIMFRTPLALVRQMHEAFHQNRAIAKHPQSAFSEFPDESLSGNNAPHWG
jgi:exopolysaccharide production protein ExoY